MRTFRSIELILTGFIILFMITRAVEAQVVVRDSVVISDHPIIEKISNKPGISLINNSGFIPINLDSVFVIHLPEGGWVTASYIDMISKGGTPPGKHYGIDFVGCIFSLSEPEQQTIFENLYGYFSYIIRDGAILPFSIRSGSLDEVWFGEASRIEGVTREMSLPNTWRSAEYPPGTTLVMGCQIHTLLSEGDFEPGIRCEGELQYELQYESELSCHLSWSKITYLFYEWWPPIFFECAYGGSIQINCIINDTTQCDHFEIGIEPDTIRTNQTATIYIQAKDENDKNAWIPGGTLLSITMDNIGQSCGSLIGPDGTIGETLVGVTYVDANTGNIKYRADGDLPEELVKAEIIVEQMDALTMRGVGQISLIGLPDYYFHIVSDPPVIAYDDTANITVIAKDFENYKEVILPTFSQIDMAILGGVTFEGELWPIGVCGNLSNLAGLSSHIISDIYTNTRSGFIQYLANGEEPEDLVRIRISASDGDGIGEGVIVVRGFIPYLDISFSPPDMAPGDTASLIIQLKDPLGNDVYSLDDIILPPDLNIPPWFNFPDDIPLDIFILEERGSSLIHGNFLMDDGYTSPSLENIPYHAAHDEEIKYIANFPFTGDKKKVHVQSEISIYPKVMGIGIIEVGEKTDELDHFEVQCEPDTIAYDKTSVITVQAKKADNTDIDLAEETLLDFSLDSEGEKYGTLTGPDDISGKVLAGISYEDANSGEVKYIADGEEPDSLTEVIITVIKSDHTEINGESNVVIIPPTKIEFLNANEQVADQVQIALWDNAYDGSGNVKTDFIDQDTRKFFIRVMDWDKNINNSDKDLITLNISTLVPVPWIPDQSHSITLEESSNNTGIFISEAQMLMSQDLDNVIETDDGYEVYSRFTGHKIMDDVKDDRTHKCYPGGKVIARYQSSNEEELVVEINIPEPQLLDIHCIVLTEPYHDIGYDHDSNPATPDTAGMSNGKFDFLDTNGNGRHDPGEPSEPYLDITSNIKGFFPGQHRRIILEGDGKGPLVTSEFVEAQRKRANIYWAQAEIRVAQIDSIDFLDNNPKDHENIDILEDALFDPYSDMAITYHAFSSGMDPNVLHVFFTSPIPHPISKMRYLGFAWHPGNSPSPHSHCYISNKAQIVYGTLGHEIGHILSHKDDVGYVDPWLFFPQKLNKEDINVKWHRRIPADIAQLCKTNAMLQ